MRVLIPLFLCFLARGASAQDLPGAWLVAGKEGRREGLRQLEGKGGSLRLRFRHAALGALALEGRAYRGGFCLQGQGQRARLGAAERLGGEASAPPRGVDVRVVGRVQQDGSVVADLQAGALRFTERWSRAAGSLEVLAVEPAVFDPKRGDGPLRIRIAVRGPEALDAQLGILLPPEPRAKSARWSFYHGGSQPKAPPGAPVYGRDLGRLSPGEHTIAWDGRDRFDQRLLLAGRYVIALRSPTAATARGEVRVAEPHLSSLAAAWPKTGHRESTTVYGAPSASTFASFLGDAPPRTRGRYETHTNLAWRRPAALYRALHGSAVVYATTHGAPRGLALQSKRPHGRPPSSWSCGASRGPCDATCWRERRATGFIDAAALERALPLARGETGSLPGLAQVERPLDDVLLVVLYACETGAGRLPRKLRALGVDCVVSFSSNVAMGQKPGWIEHLVKRAVDELHQDIATVAREAALASDAVFWTPARLRAARERRSRASKLREALVVLPEDFNEPLFPARYGAPNQ